MESGICDLATSVRAASAREDVRNAVTAVYADLDARIAVRRPLCVSSGRCCHFNEYGHRLYVTTMELARFVFDLSQAGISDQNVGGVMSDNPSDFRHSLTVLPASGQERTGGCPFQVANRCGVHGMRPFGCRIFFCDASSTQFQYDVYAEFHDRFRRLHDELEVPYFYVEWRNALEMAGVQWLGGSGR